MDEVKSSTTPGANSSPPTSTATARPTAPLRPDTIDVVERFYRSRTSWRTKRNFQVFTATDFLAAAVERIPPKNQHTIRYYGRYSNKSRGLEVRPWKPSVDPAAPHTVPAPHKRSARNLRPLWRNLILRIWGSDPLICPCCKGLMRTKGRLQRPEEIQFFLQLHGLWEGIGDFLAVQRTERPRREASRDRRRTRRAVKKTRPPHPHPAAPGEAQLRRMRWNLRRGFAGFLGSLSDEPGPTRTIYGKRWGLLESP